VISRFLVCSSFRHHVGESKVKDGAISLEARRSRVLSLGGIEVIVVLKVNAQVEVGHRAVLIDLGRATPEHPVVLPRSEVGAERIGRGHQEEHA
jgi:hypothetical protein